jgi:hypothetical protein
LGVIDREELLKASKVVDADDLLKKVREWSLILQRKRCFMADGAEGLTFGLGFFYILQFANCMARQCHLFCGQ